MSQFKKRPGPVVISRELLLSPAYFDLGAKACQVLGVFFCKRKMANVPNGKRKEWMCTNNGEIVFTYDEAEGKYQISRQAFSRALGELIEHGFLDIEVPGIGIGSAPTLYALSDRWTEWGKEGFVTKTRIKRYSHRFPKGKENPYYQKTQV